MFNSHALVSVSDMQFSLSLSLFVFSLLYALVSELGLSTKHFNMGATHVLVLGVL